MQDQTRTEVEAAVFRRLVQHLQDHTEVQKHRPHDFGGLLQELPVQMVCCSRW